LLNKNISLRILTTSRQRINNLDGLAEKVFNLDNLTPVFALELLEKKAGKNLQPEIEKLLEKKPDTIQQANSKLILQPKQYKCI
jgi:hypothetical protein